MLYQVQDISYKTRWLLNEEGTQEKELNVTQAMAVADMHRRDDFLISWIH